MNPFIIVLFYLLFTRTLRYSQIYPSIRCVCCWYYYVYGSSDEPPFRDILCMDYDRRCRFNICVYEEVMTKRTFL